MKLLKEDLKTVDPLISKLVELEENRQNNKLHLNAAISISPKSVSDVQSTVFANVDAEGYIPDYIKNESLEDLENIDKQIDLYSKYRDERCNKCCEYVDIVEGLAQKRLARLFANELVKEDEIHVNVQVPSGALANFLVYESFLVDGDILLSLSSDNGGHTTHGSDEHESYNKYKVMNFHVNYAKSDIDYDELEELLKYNPKMLILGPTSFPIEIKWKKVRELIDKTSPKTIFVADIAHIAGLVAAKVYNSPFGIADIVTFVGYKTFGGPRTGAIFTTNKEYSRIIDETVFPKYLGSAITLDVAALAVSANIALTDEYKLLQSKIISNSRYLCEELKKLDVPIVYETSDTHIVLIDVNRYGNSSKIATYFEDCGIMVNSCLVPFDNTIHEGIRLGTTWITELGFGKEEMKEIAHIVALALEQQLENISIIQDRIKVLLDSWRL